MTDRNQDKKDDFIFGLRPVIEAIEAGKTIDKIFIQNGLQGDIITELKKLLSKHGIRANYVPVEKLNRFTRKNHQGVVAFISDVAFYKVEDVVPQLFEEGKVPFLLILDRLTDVRNFGAICRTAECVGVDAVIIPDKGAAPINSDAMKTSAGAIYNIKICKEKNLAHTVDYLQQSGILPLRKRHRNCSTRLIFVSHERLRWVMRKQEFLRKFSIILMRK